MNDVLGETVTERSNAQNLVHSTERLQPPADRHLVFYHLFAAMELLRLFKAAGCVRGNRIIEVAEWMCVRDGEMVGSQDSEAGER